MLSENKPSLRQVNWITYSDNMDLKTDANYVFKVDVEKYYNLINADYSNLLSPDEIAKADCFKQDADKRRFISGRYFIRYIISKRFHQVPADIVLKYTKFNKPFLPGIEFNITHSGNYLLVAISNNPIGIDIEFIDDTFDYKVMLHDIFNANEIAYVKNNQANTLNFYTLWTRKEALLKATGEGLIDDLKKVNCLDNVVERQQSRYILTSFTIDNYMAGLASTANSNLIFLNYN
ncbi:MAG: 4'-phosphopantetheinyl transferase superfamily protein [Bacteroidota bacterium]